jgi:nitrogenase cofactor biosynthesis protein NifB
MQFYGMHGRISDKGGDKMSAEVRAEAVSIEEKTLNHPCFHCGASNNARIHLPIAPKCNIQCNYCVRKFDCSNESRPGVVSKILTPAEAVQRYQEVKSTLPELTVVGIAGPGDALANFLEVKETLEIIRQSDPQITFCLSTNGLMLPFYANQLISLGVSHVTVTVNAIDAETGAKIYDHVNYLGKTYQGIEGAAILLQNQQTGIRYLTSMGIVVKANIVLLKGINDSQIMNIVHTVKEWGCQLTNIMPLIPVKESAFEFMETVSNAEHNRIRKECGEIVPQMYHCRQCRADAIGTLNHDLNAVNGGMERKSKNEATLFAACPV